MSSSPSDVGFGDFVNIWADKIGTPVSKFTQGWINAVEREELKKKYSTTIVIVNKDTRRDARRFSSARRRKKVIQHNARRVAVRHGCYPVNLEEVDHSTRVSDSAHLPTFFVYSTKGATPLAEENPSS